LLKVLAGGGCMLHLLEVLRLLFFGAEIGVDKRGRFHAFDGASGSPPPPS